ncbi:MAG: hypothetical protein ABID09_00645, partial [Candidatus Omnitrophota bacterium]
MKAWFRRGLHRLYGYGLHGLGTDYTDGECPQSVAHGLHPVSNRSLITAPREPNTQHPESRGYNLSNFRNTHLCKIIAYILVFTFVIYDITWAQGGAPITLKEIRSIGKVTPDGKLDDIKIPYEAGWAQDAYKNGGDKTILNIQDPHASLDAQFSIVKILEHLASNYDLNLIA